jgi:hypothetical protein
MRKTPRCGEGKDADRHFSCRHSLTGALASCGTDQPADDQNVVEAPDSNEFTAANDITAIDAATGEAANMAADVDFTANEPITP